MTKKYICDSICKDGHADEVIKNKAGQEILCRLCEQSMCKKCANKDYTMHSSYLIAGVKINNETKTAAFRPDI